MAILLDEIDFTKFLAETDQDHKIRKASDFLRSSIDHWKNKGLNPCAKMPWEKTKNLIGFRPGEVTLWGGMNGHGKSLVLGQLTVGFARQKQTTVIASMEMKVETTIERMIRQEYGAGHGEEAFHHFHDWTDELLWIYNQMGAVKPETMLSVLRYCASELKADHFIIDSLMKCGVAEDDYTGQKHFLDQICAIARDSNMHIHLVAHSKKLQNELVAPGKYDVKGSGSITDQVDNVITVWRNKKKEADSERGVVSSEPDCFLICDKQRNGEWEGKIGLWLDKKFFAFRETDGF